MFDLILKNGTLVNEGKIFESDIAIKGNRIEKIAASIDAESKNETGQSTCFTFISFFSREEIKNSLVTPGRIFSFRLGV